MDKNGVICLQYKFTGGSIHLERTVREMHNIFWDAAG